MNRYSADADKTAEETRNTTDVLINTEFNLSLIVISETVSSLLCDPPYQLPLAITSTNVDYIFFSTEIYLWRTSSRLRQT